MNRAIRLLCSLSALLVVAGCPKSDSEAPVIEDENSVKIESFSPRGRTGTQPIEVRFSKDIVGQDEVGKPVKQTYLEVEPNMAGWYEWREPSLLAFVPREPFRPSTRYHVKVRDTAAGKYRLIGEDNYDFHTELFQLRSVTPFFEGAEPSIRVRANLEFTHPVDPKAVEARVRFEDSFGNPIDAQLESRTIDRVMAFRLDRVLRTEEAKEIKIQLSSSLGPSGGGEPLGKDVTRSMTYAGPKALEVHEIFPSQYDGQPSVQIRFSTDLQFENLSAAISVAPAVDYRVSDAYRGAILVGGFKPGTSYTVTIKKGLMSTQGAVLEDAVSRVVVVPDFEPQIRFDSLGSYLMKSGEQSFSVQTVNVDKVTIRVDKVFENNIVHVLPRLRSGGRSSCYEGECYDEYYDDEYGGGYYDSDDLTTMGRSLFTGEVDVEEKKNEWISTAIPFKEIDEDDRRGLYRVRISDEDRGWIYAEKWMLATDLGLTTKVGKKDARVQVISLSTLAPVAGVEVSFISQTNQTIGTARTDADGVAVQNLANLERGEPLALVTARRGSDFSYLALSGTAVPTADFDVGGDGDTTSPYEAYVYSDRGVYRPGDKANVTVLVRDATLSTPPAFPYKVEIRTPRWRLFETRRGNTQVDGAQAFTIDFPADALTGDYTLRVLTPDGQSTLGRLTLKVEDFMPDRIKVDVKAEKETGSFGEPAEFAVESAYLFGAKAAGLAYDAQCQFYETSVRTKEWGSFAFGSDDPNEDRRALSHTEDLGEGSLDEEGKTNLSCGLETGVLPRRPVRVSLMATVSERGGRAVTGVGSALLHAHEYYVGVRRNASESYAEVGKDAGLEVMAVDQQGAPKAGAVIEATFYEIEWKSVLKFVNNRYRYVSERSERKISTTKVTTKSGPVKLPFASKKTGQIRVDIDSGSTHTQSTTTFWVSGGGYAAWEMSKPDQIALTLDKADYAPGETAKVMLRAPFSGTVYVTVERDRVLTSRTVELEGNSGTVYLPVTSAMTPNAYVVAQLIRSPKSVEKQAPMRAFGVVPLTVRSEQHRLTVGIEAPPEIRPNQPLEVKVKVDGARGFARVTLAAVDEGILRITSFSSPDPFKFFTRKKRLGLRTHDMFDMLLPEVRTKSTSILRGGGGDEEIRKKHLTPVSVKRVKPVALWSGIVQVGADGTATVRLDVPEFQGALRLMAVAFERERFGASNTLVRVRDPIVLTPTLPRFMAPLDEIEVPVEVFNGTGKPAEIAVSVSTEGRLTIKSDKTQKISLAPDAQGMVNFRLLADEVAGRAKVVLSASGGGASTKSTTELPIRPPNTVTTEGTSLSVSWNAPGKVKIPGGYLPGSMKTHVTMGPVPVAQFGASLQYLIRYPYGCVEQTTSRSFPLLYLKDLARQSSPEIADDASIDVYVNAGIARLSGMLNQAGGLSYWPGGSYGYAWSTIYGTHFLVEAKRAGYEIDQKVLDQLLAHLNQISSGATLSFYNSLSADLRARAYALYVLSLAGRPNHNALLYAADEVFKPAKAGDKAPRADTETRTLVAGALMLAGKRSRAEQFFGGELALAEPGPRRGFWSTTRADALMLSVLADVAPRHRSVLPLMQNLIEHAHVGRWSNTQENAYALMALGKIGRVLGSDKYWGTVSIGSEELKRFNSENASSVGHEGSDWVGKELEITVTGKGTAFVGVQIEGIRAGLLQPKAKGLQVSRSFRDREGQPIDPGSLHQGDLVVVRIEVSADPGARVENIAVVDLLAAGLEIENPRLSSESVLPWMNDRAVADYTDIRDDRLILFTSVDAGNKRAFYYTARAVTKGSFILPHVHAEAMYDPAVQAYSGGGKLVVQ